MPYLRTFRIIRWAHGVNVEPGTFETIEVQGHAIAVADDDRTVIQRWKYIHPALPPQQMVVRVLTGVIDLEDVSPKTPVELEMDAQAAAEPSRIIH